MSSHSNERLKKMRRTRTAAIQFWQQWLEDMHREWDGRGEQTFLLAPAKKTLPFAQYKQSVPLPHGMSEAEVTTPLCNSLLSTYRILTCQQTVDKSDMLCCRSG